MLEFIRSATKSWVAKAFLGLLVASFAVFGISDAFQGGAGSAVITAGDQSVSAQDFANAYNREIQGAQRQFGQSIDSQMAEALGLNNRVLSRLAAEATLDQTSYELGLSASDEAVATQILGDPSFQDGGNFSDEQYRYLLAQNSFTVEDYEDETRRSIARSQIASALSRGADAPLGSGEILHAWQQEQRRFDYVVLDLENHTDEPVTPSDADLTAFYEENSEMFMAAEQRDAVYLHLSIDQISQTVSVDDEELRAAYEARSSEYNLPETRAIYQVIFNDMVAATAAAGRISSGEISFDDLLAERGETRADVSLGELTASELSTEIANAAFAASDTGLVGPVDTGFGAALLDVAAITPAQETPFEDAKDELAVDFRRDGALDIAPELAGEIEDLRAGGMTLEEVAAEMGLELQTAKAVELTGGEGFASDETFINEIFSAEIGDERDLVETADGGYFVLRLEEVNEAALRPFEDVREMAIGAWTVTERARALGDLASAALDRVNEGEMLALIADEAGTDMLTEGPFTRNVPWTSITAEMVTELFTKPMGGAAIAPAPGRPDAVVIAQVVGIETPEAGDASDAQLASLNEQLSRMAADDALQLFLTAKQEEVGINIDQQLLDSILTQSGGNY
ncbi:MAG: SurA N-terminal domain-containing protein [Pikeienuella sp.]